MHGETFADLLANLEDAREKWEQAFDQRLREMTNKLDGVV
jgi:predicted RNase H-like HicB family nuclease